MMVENHEVQEMLLSIKPWPVCSKTRIDKTLPATGLRAGLHLQLTSSAFKPSFASVFWYLQIATC